MKRWLAGLLLVMYLMVGAVAWAQPQVPPAPTTGSLFVQDYAGVLSSDTKNKISLFGSQLKGKTKAHIVVVTVKSLEGMPISDYALAILRQWGVGDKTLNNGVVMVVALDDRQSRIEVGYGLEGALPDAKTGRIQDEYMLPYFQRGDYDQGILNGYQALVGEVAKEYNVDINIAAKTAHRPKQASSISWWDSLPSWVHLLILAALAVLLVIDWLFFGGTITLLILSLFRFRGGGGGGGGGFGGGSGGGGGSDRRW
jgi:uncharacterized protein